MMNKYFDNHGSSSNKKNFEFENFITERDLTQTSKQEVGEKMHN